MYQATTANGGTAAPGDDRAAPVPRPALAYNPALDGIRGLAVAAVLLFHGGFPWARGGYLGVSTFFTLSGFLITTLLVGERDETGGIALGAFWARRLRRLLPASALTLAAVAAGAHLVAEWRTESAGGDLLAAALQVANWRFIADGQSYGDLFAEPSPVLHFWSLAIEEQFYWLFPLLTSVVFAVGRGSVRAYAAVLGGLLAVAAAATVALGAGASTTVYYATHTRMGEILVGSLLAVAVARGLAAGALVRRLAAAAGVAALAATLWAWWNVEHGTPAVSRGGLLAFAGVSAALVLGATVPGPVQRLLGAAPLRLLGVVSYGVYLVHWPIFLVVDADRTGLDRAPLFALRLVITLGAAVASYHLLERPVRAGWSLPRVPMPAVAVTAVGVVALAAVAVPAPTVVWDERVEAYLEGVKFTDPADIPAHTRLGVAFGDSTMLRTGLGLSEWGRSTEELWLAGRIGDMLGCGIGRGGERRARSEPTEAPPGCDDWPELIAEEVSALRARYGRLEFAVVQTGPWDVADRLLAGDDTWRAPGDPVFDRHLYDEISLATDLLREQDLVVVWLLAPHIAVGRNEEPPPDPPYPESDPARIDRLNEIIERVAAEREGVAVIDLAGHLQGLPAGEMDPELRPDGVHFTPETAIDVAGWLGPELLAAVAAESGGPVPADAEPAAPAPGGPPTVIDP